MSAMLLRATFLAVAIALPVSTASLAQSWPQRTVRIIVPNPPGASLDVQARLFAERLASFWKSPVVVENIAGADGLLALKSFVARRDDHTLLYSFLGPITINPVIYQSLPYDPAADLVPIAPMSDNLLAIAVPATSQVTSLEALERFARSRPGKLNWAATPGLPYFAFAGFQKAAGLDMVQVPYRSLSQPVADLIEGRIDALAAGVAPLLSHVSSGRVRFLAFLNTHRATFVPEVPTMAEAGYPSLGFDAVTGFFGWRDMPIQLRERVAADLHGIAEDAALKELLAANGSVSRLGSPAEFATLIEEQRAKVAAIAKTIDVEPKP
jgi:tripartite-type tricarboxylate transporter receptor subunit TctC